METKMKLLQKNFKNERIPYIYIKNSKLFATDSHNIGIYEVESEDKTFDMKTLKYVHISCNLDIDNNVLMKAPRDRIKVPKKLLVTIFKEMKEYIKVNKNNVKFDISLEVEIPKHSNELVFTITGRESNFSPLSIRRFSITLENNTGIFYPEFRDTYIFKEIEKYVKSCEGKEITIKYASMCKGIPLYFDDGVIYKFYTMPANPEYIGG